MRTGTVMSIQATATGRVFAAFLPPKQVERMVEQERRSGVAGDFGAADMKSGALEKILLDIRKRGMARVEGNPIPGINAVCAPVFEHSGAIKLGITAIGPAGSFDVSWTHDNVRKIRECAEQVSHRLGYRPVA
jgi:DNA-binding IclR family transcriptional regulator